jgi:hypothetical protein
VFVSRYPFTKLVHPRVLCSKARERGVTIYPKPFGRPPPEIRHSNSVAVPLPLGGLFIVTEWTTETRELHKVDW